LISDLAGEGDSHARSERVRVDRRAAGREEDRAGAPLEHRSDHGRRGGDCAENAELERAADVFDVVSRIGFMNSGAGSGEYSDLDEMRPTGMPSRRSAGRLRRRGWGRRRR
jgi:hypothetical protein